MKKLIDHVGHHYGGMSPVPQPPLAETAAPAVLQLQSTSIGPLAPTTIGTDGNDNNLEFGLGGSDTIFGGGGNDILDGGVGADFLVGGDGLIVEASAERTDNMKVQLGSLELHKRKVFMVHGSNFAGYLVASSVFWHEDEVHHFDESLFPGIFLEPAAVIRLTLSLRAARP